MEKVMFALPLEEGWPPVSSEGVWCERVEGHFKLKNAPFFIKGIAVGDVFSAEEDSVNKHVFEFKLVEVAGHSVVWFMNPGHIETAGLEKSLLNLGCNIETLPIYSVAAVDVPPFVNIETLDTLVAEYEEKGLAFAFPVWRHE